jgi:mono/diheme cytochrome c family protein
MGSRPLTVAVAVAIAASVALVPSIVLVAQDVPASNSVNAGVFTSDQAERGRKQFQLACESCHNVGEHTGKNFESKWGGSNLGDLFDLVSNTMPESDPGSLKPEQYASILAFFLSESGFKRGDTELPPDLEALKKIRIETPAK